MNYCDAIITEVHYISPNKLLGVPKYAQWECKYTYNCCGSITTAISHDYCKEALEDKYKVGKVILV